ncbi:MAG: hypothetical protein RLZZ234_806 [Candidatus Parcubacteria bacterium]
MKKSTFVFTASVWLYPGAMSSWHFITVPKDISLIIKKQFGANTRGWGSLPVSVKIDGTTWQTSIFPDAKAGTFLLPLKASVRKSVGLFENDRAKVHLTITP